MTLHLAGSLLYVLGLGCLLYDGVVLLARRKSRPARGYGRPARPAELARALSLRMGMGVLIHALAVMAGLPVRHVLLAGAVLAGLGLLAAGRRVLARPLRRQVVGAELLWLALGLAVIAVVATLLPMDVLWKNDARSVWFFHGKLIYYAGSLGADAGFREPAISFSLPQYPKLVPILAASEMMRFGYWNEYLPKLALVPPLACYVLALLAGARGVPSLASFGVLIVALLAGGGLLHDGYADAYVALPAAGALMATMRWLRRGLRQDAEHAIVLLGLALATKEEGRLLAVAFAAGLLPYLLRARVRKALLQLLSAKLSLATLVLALAPSVLWAVRASSFGLHGYLKLDHAAKARLFARFNAGALRKIVPSLMQPSSRWFDAATSAFWGLLGTAAAVKLAAVAVSRRLQSASLFCLLVGAAYFALLCLVYLMTPFDYSWQLDTSADRVMLITFICVLVFMGDALEDLERPTCRWPRPARAEAAEKLRT